MLHCNKMAVVALPNMWSSRMSPWPGLSLKTTLSTCCDTCTDLAKPQNLNPHTTSQDSRSVPEIISKDILSLVNFVNKSWNTMTDQVDQGRSGWRIKELLVGSKVWAPL